MKKGFTLIEILVVVAAVAILSMIVIQLATYTPTNSQATQTSTAIEGQVIPPPTDWIVDESGVLTPETIASVKTKLAGYATDGIHGELGVLLVKKLNGLSIEEYGIRVGESWKVGKYGQDNGVILIIATEDRKVRIETGSASKITDAEADSLLQTYIVPSLKKNDWNGAVVAGVDAIISAERNK
jgi:uncharacterized protein